MSIIKWEPFGSLDRFFDEIPTLSFKNLSLDLAADVYEENNTIVAKMNLPGVDPSKINVTVENNSLHISGAHSEEKEKKDKYYYSKEIRQGTFERMIPLPHPIKKDKISAEYNQGVLVVTMPKEESKESSKKIEIKVKN